MPDHRRRQTGHDSVRSSGGKTDDEPFAGERTRAGSESSLRKAASSRFTERVTSVREERSVPSSPSRSLRASTEPLKPASSPSLSRRASSRTLVEHSKAATEERPGSEGGRRVIQSKRSEPNLRSRAEVRSQSVVVDPGHHNSSVINIHQKISSTRTRDDRIAREMRELELERIELEREQVNFYERKLRLERKQLKLEREQLKGERENARVAKLIELMELKQRVRSRWDMKKIEEVIESLL